MDTESKFSSHLTKLFLARATARAESKNLAEESRYTISLIHVRVALICCYGKR